MHIAILRKYDSVSQHWLQNSLLRFCLNPKPLPAKGLTESGYCAHCSCRYFIDHIVCSARIQSDLICFLLPALRWLHSLMIICQHCFHFKTAARYFHIGKSVILFIPYNLKYPGSEFFRIFPALHMCIHKSQQLLNTLHLQCRTE